MKSGVIALGLAAMALTACATTGSLIPEQRNELRTRAHECRRAHPEVEDYQVDRFGTVTAYYRMAGSAAASTDPFFACVFRR
jgi:hypothetical protein